MYKVLLLSYTPRIGSHTARLVKTAMEHLPRGAEVTRVDLANSPPPLLDGDLLNVLIKANFTDEELTQEEQVMADKATIYVTQLLNADRIVVAFPMYNFSLPAPVKAWVDLVVQKDKTFGIDGNGQYKGLCNDKSALILMTTGNDFNEPHFTAYNHAQPLMQANLEFMAIPSVSICAYGLDQYPDKCEHLIEQAQAEVVDFLTGDSHWNAPVRLTT